MGIFSWSALSKTNRNGTANAASPNLLGAFSYSKSEDESISGGGLLRAAVYEKADAWSARPSLGLRFPPYGRAVYLLSLRRIVSLSGLGYLRPLDNRTVAVCSRVQVAMRFSPEREIGDGTTRSERMLEVDEKASRGRAGSVHGSEYVCEDTRRWEAIGRLSNKAIGSSREVWVCLFIFLHTDATGTSRDAVSIFEAKVWFNIQLISPMIPFPFFLLIFRMVSLCF
ncbi:hypothetical protein DFH11DRAFT_1271230 [Phellopilus nigrolimitatus]|nr:hypothetical protein DFH11DRAFT_1271230 [Phellopilus nigrolimitatus]